MTIPELLKTMFYRSNQSLLSKELGVNRGTLRKYMGDSDGEFHSLKKVDGKYQLFTNQTNKIVPLYKYNQA